MSRAILISDHESFNKELREKLVAFGYSACRFDQSDLEIDKDDFVVIDMDAMGIEYHELQEFIQEYQLHVIAMSTYPRFNQGVQLLKIGVKGYLNRYTEKRNMAHAISSVLEGGVWFDPGVMNELIANITINNSIVQDQEELKLTEREIQIASYVAKGISNKEIALQQGITERTVKAHLLACYQKIGVHDRVSLALWAKRVLNV